MEIIKEVLIIILGVSVLVCLLRLLWQAVSKEVETVLDNLGPTASEDLDIKYLGPTTSENLDLDTGSTKYDKAGIVHPPVLLDSHPIEDETIKAALDYALKLEGDRKVGKYYKQSQKGNYSEPILKSSSNDGFIWTESEIMSNDSFDSLYHTSHDIDSSPSFGNGGDFGGGGASGSWDSGSSSDSSYDSGSSDSSSSWSD